MGYGSIYADRTVSHLKEREVSYLDRLFVKALINTPFGRKERERLEAGKRAGEEVVFTLFDNDIDRMDGAESLYQQTGLNVFGDNEFAFRDFHDTREYIRSFKSLENVPLLTPPKIILDNLSESIDKALVEVERRCLPSKIKPDYVSEGPEFRSGAWQLYDRVRDLVPKILSTKIDRRTIRKIAEKQREEEWNNCNGRKIDSITELKI